MTKQGNLRIHELGTTCNLASGSSWIESSPEHRLPARSSCDTILSGFGSQFESDYLRVPTPDVITTASVVRQFPVLVSRLLPLLIYPQAVAFHTVCLVITFKLLDPHRASTCSKCWSLAEAETQGPVAASQPPVSLQEQKKNRSKAICDCVCARNSQKIFSYLYNCKLILNTLPIENLAPWPVKEFGYITLCFFFFPHRQFIIFLINICMLSRYLGILLTLVSHLLVLFFIFH